VRHLQDDGAAGLEEGNRPREVIVKAARVARSVEAKRDATERNRGEEEMAMQCDRGARVTLEQELAAVLRDLAVVTTLQSTTGRS